VIELRAGTRIWLAAGITDMRRGFHGLSAQVQTVLEQEPYSGHVFLFRPVLISEASGARSFHLAAGHQRNGVAEPRSIVDVARRHRLETAGSHMAAADGGMNHI
jgi:hypothetical protein